MPTGKMMKLFISNAAKIPEVCIFGDFLWYMFSLGKYFTQNNGFCFMIQ